MGHEGYQAPPRQYSLQMIPFYFCFLFWGYSWWYSELTPGPVLKDHSWKTLGDHMGSGRLSQNCCMQGNALPAVLMIRPWWVPLFRAIFLISPVSVTSTPTEECGTMRCHHNSVSSQFLYLPDSNDTKRMQNYRIMRGKPITVLEVQLPATCFSERWPSFDWLP